MNDGVIIQFAQGPLHLAMLEAVRPLHERYASRHGFDLRQVEEPGPVTSAYGWLRWQYIRAGLETYQHVVLLETDVMIANLAVDLRTATDVRPLAMHYGQAPSGEPCHYQTGVIFARKHPEVCAFLDAIMAVCPAADVPEETGLWWWRPHCQQVIANVMLHEPRWAAIVDRLDARWNDVWGVPNAIVRAWHGVPGEGNKLDAMRSAARGYDAA